MKGQGKHTPDTVKIGGFQRVSLIDYPGKLTSIVFVTGCNMRCPFCQNKDLILKKDENLVLYSEELVLEQLKKSRNFLDAVEITGGEPTLQSGLKEFIRRCKELGLAVKLDTNGLNPQILKDLLGEGLLDYVAMDIKSSLEPDKYAAAAGVSSSQILGKVMESIKVIMNSAPDYEFRTTVVPSLVEIEDLAKIAKKIEGANAYYIQQFNPKDTLDPKFSKFTPYPLEALIHERNGIKDKGLIKKCEVRF